MVSSPFPSKFLCKMIHVHVLHVCVCGGGYVEPTPFASSIFIYSGTPLLTWLTSPRPPKPCEHHVLKRGKSFASTFTACIYSLHLHRLWLNSEHPGWTQSLKMGEVLNRVSSTKGWVPMNWKENRAWGAQHIHESTKRKQGVRRRAHSTNMHLQNEDRKSRRHIWHAASTRFVDVVQRWPLRRAQHAQMRSADGHADKQKGDTGNHGVRCSLLQTQLSSDGVVRWKSRFA